MDTFLFRDLLGQIQHLSIQLLIRKVKGEGKIGHRINPEPDFGHQSRQKTLRILHPFLPTAGSLLDQFCSIKRIKFLLVTAGKHIHIDHLQIR
ncbi:hypothetical protein SDC9_170678 [bioreactor metagenome]|uniref:Uncharacterized protein n=1 Tax=bioreactor metagenome TaxID=1076179 RepID=A0A645GB74_9ZZZZ